MENTRVWGYPGKATFTAYSLHKVLNYRIRPNYRVVRLRFFKITGKTCGKMCIRPLSTLKNKKDQQMTYLMMCMRFFFLIFFIKVYFVGTYLNCIRNICLYKEVDKNTPAVVGWVA